MRVVTIFRGARGVYEEKSCFELMGKATCRVVRIHPSVARDSGSGFVWAQYVAAGGEISISESIEVPDGVITTGDIGHRSTPGLV